MIKATTTWLWKKLLVMIYNGWSSFVIHNSTHWQGTRSTMLSNSWYLKMHGWSRDLLLYFFLTWRFTIIFFINRQESSHISIEFYLKKYYIFIIIYQKALSNPAATRGESPSFLTCSHVNLVLQKLWRPMVNPRGVWGQDSWQTQPLHSSSLQNSKVLLLRKHWHEN